MTMFNDSDLNDDAEVELTIGEAAIRKWANIKRISRPSVEHLIDLGFDSMKALALLTETDLAESDIPLGQRKLIIYSVKQTFPQGMAATCQANTLPTGQPFPRGMAMGPSTPIKVLHRSHRSRCVIRRGHSQTER
jgi:hypothetical protein